MRRFRGNLAPRLGLRRVGPQLHPDQAHHDHKQQDDGYGNAQTVKPTAAKHTLPHLFKTITVFANYNYPLAKARQVGVPTIAAVRQAAIGHFYL